MQFDFPAKYTMTLHDALKIDETLLDGIDYGEDEGMPELTEAVRKAVIARFDLYEIGGETLPEFKLYILRKFEQYSEYYKRLMLSAAELFDWKIDSSRAISEAVTMGNTRDFTPRAKYQNVTESVNTDLPRSTVSQEHPTDKVNTTSTNEGLEGSDTTVDAGYDNKTVTDTNTTPLRNWKRFVDSIRNVTYDFADKFRPCFINLFN